MQNSNPRRVGLVAACAFPAPRGSQILIDEMAVALTRAGVQAHLVAPFDPTAPPRPYQTHPLSRFHRARPGLSVHGLSALARPLFDLALVARLAEVTRRERLEVLHAHNYEGLIAALAVRQATGVPVVYHSHNVLADELPHYAPEGLARQARKLGAWFDRTFPARADRVVALTGEVGDYLVENGVDRSRLTVIPPGLDPTPFACPSDHPRAPRAVFAGNLDGYQNLEVLLDAWGMAARVRQDLDLTLVTHADRGPLVRGLTARGLNERVRLVRASSVSEVARELSTAMVGVSPRTSWSGFPIKTLNYMASGLPTVAFEGSAKGVRNGETGWVVPDGNPGALADALVRSLTSPDISRQQGRAAFRTLRADHSWERLTPGLLEVSAAARSEAGRSLGERAELLSPLHETR